MSIKVDQFINSRFASNTFLLSQECTKDVWVIDPGDISPISEWMAMNGKNEIKGVLLTHSHFDHIYGVNEIVSLYPSCIVYIANEYGLIALHNPKINGSKFTEEGPIEITENAKVEYYDDTMQLWDGVKMKTIKTPGHSDDSMCLLVEGLLFTGDTLIKDIRTVTKLKGGSVERLEESIKAIEALKGYDLRVMPGHGEIFELDEYDLYKMKNNPLNKKYARKI